MIFIRQIFDIVCIIIYICVWMGPPYRISHWAPEKSGTVLVASMHYCTGKIANACFNNLARQIYTQKTPASCCSAVRPCPHSHDS
jgi:hypothetical protein